MWHRNSTSRPNWLRALENGWARAQLRNCPFKCRTRKCKARKWQRQATRTALEMLADNPFPFFYGKNAIHTGELVFHLPTRPADFDSVNSGGIA